MADTPKITRTLKVKTGSLSGSLSGTGSASLSGIGSASLSGNASASLSGSASASSTGSRSSNSSSAPFDSSTPQPEPGAGSDATPREPTGAPTTAPLSPDPRPPEDGGCPPPVEADKDSGKGFEIQLSNRRDGCDHAFEARVVWRGGCCPEDCGGGETPHDIEPTLPPESSSPEPKSKPPEEEVPTSAEPSCEPEPRPEEHTAPSDEPDPIAPSREPDPEPSCGQARCLEICLGLSSELPPAQRLVFLTEAVAKINARLFALDSAKAMPCCVRCAGLELDEDALLRDASCLLETAVASSASIVAYSMGRELAAGVGCRVVLVNDERLAYQREDGSVLDPVSKFGDPTQEEQGHGQCCCE